jgi:geranylgeranylglycerol-phosphate geranylgeranyltransferase
MIGFSVIVGEIIAATPFFSGQAALYGFLTGFLLLASSMVLNDYSDRDVDAINEPERPIPSGNVKPTQAMSFAVVLCALGFLSASQTGVWTLIVAGFSMVVAAAYNFKFKKTGLPGNALVSANVALPFIYGGLVVGRQTSLLLVFATLAFISSMGREVVKGIVDVTGDASKGIQSVAVKMGNAYAAKQGAALFLMAVGLSAVPIALGVVSNYYIPLVIISDIGFALTSYSIVTNPSARNAKRNKKYALLWMLFGLLAFVFGAL